MAISSGAKFGHFDVVALIGEGGMGQVYRAVDTQLNRDVALKVLPPAMAADPARLARFRREAKILASLSHPNIAVIHGVEEAPGTPALVLELVEGPTLADRIADGPIPPDQALVLARQIANALVAAHAREIVHRDLKPANVKVRPDGTVKVLDFGLAKDITPGLGDGELSDAVTATGVDTVEGTVIGTPAYMSPEQVRGQPVDARADIWAFGCVLYEMLTGHKAFDSGTAIETMAAILERGPDWAGLPASTPPAVSALLRRCLERDPNQRWNEATDIARELSEAALGRATPDPARPSIAVLPFADMSAGKDQDYFCEGLAEELIDALSRLDGLRVVARSSAFRFKGSAHDLKQIGAELDVGTVLEGSVRKAGNRLRITAQLVDIERGSHIWSERYDREMEDIFTIQDEIARAVVERLRITLLGEPTAPLVMRATASLEAYTACKKGDYYRYSRHELSKARRCYEEAVGHDADYAVAWAGLAEVAAVGGYSWIEPPREAAARARSAVDRALAIDEKLSEAHAALARILFRFDWRWADAEREYRLAVSLNQASSDVHASYSSFLSLMGRTNEALHHIALAREVDPLSVYALRGEGLALQIARRHDEAIAAYQRALELHPNNAPTLWELAWTLQACARHHDALEALEGVRTTTSPPVWHEANLGRLLGLAGHTDEALAALARLQERSRGEYVSPFSLAVVYHGLGQIDEMLRHLELAYEEHGPGLTFLQRPLWDDVRAEPRFQAVVRRIGLPDVVVASGARAAL